MKVHDLKVQTLRLVVIGDTSLLNAILQIL